MNNRVNAQINDYNDCRFKKQTSKYGDNLKLLFIIVLWIGFSFLSFFAVKAMAQDVGVQEFVYDPTRQISALAGTKSQTRISFGNVGIKEVVGDSNKYTMVHDTLGTSIFIMPKVKVDEKINITIISGGGRLQDLSLRVKDGEGGVILIRDKSRDRNIENLGVSKTVNTGSSEGVAHYKASVGIEKFSEAKEMLKSMVLGIRGKYDVTELIENGVTLRCSKCLQNRIRKNISKDRKESGVLVASTLIGLEVRETYIYKYRLAGIKGIVLEIKNKTKKREVFDNQILSTMFAGTILTNSESNTIPAKGSIYAFIVMNDKEEV